MTSEQVDITEGLDETFQVHMFWRLVVTGVLSWFGLPVLVFAIIFSLPPTGWDNPLMHISGSLVCWAIMFLFILIILGAWRIRVEMSPKGISYCATGISRARFVPWEDVVGIERLPFGQLRISVLGGRSIHIGAVVGKQRIVQLVYAMLDKFGAQDLPKQRVKPIEWTTRYVLPLVVMTAVSGGVTYLIVRLIIGLIYDFWF